MLSLKELLGFPCAKNLSVAAGSPDGRLIKRVEFIFDGKDADGVRSGDLAVLCCGIEAAGLLRLAPVLAARKAALFVAKADDPAYAGLCALAQQCGLTVLSSEGPVPFHDIIESLCKAELRESGVRFADRFMGIYRRSEGGGLFGIMRALEEIAGYRVFIYDCDEDTVISGSENPDRPSSPEEVKRMYGESLTQYGLGGSLSLWVAAEAGNLPEGWDDAAGSAFLALAVGVSDYRREFDERRSRFIYDILKRKIYDAEAGKTRLAELGFDGGLNYLCVAVGFKAGSPSSDDGDTGRKGATAAGMSLASAVGKCFKNDVITAADGRALLVFWPVEDSSSVSKSGVNGIVGRIVGRCGAFLGDKEPTVGVSSACSPIPQLGVPYSEAVQALELGGRIFGPGSVTYFDELSMYRVLLEMDDTARIDRSLGLVNKIEEYDKNNNTDLMRTLEVFYESNFNLKETAQKMFLHYNSVQYRLRRISEVTDLDITTSDGMFTLMVGMKLKNYLK